MNEDPAQPNINSWLEDELFSQYRTDRRNVDTSWGQIFDHTPPTNGSQTNGAPGNGSSARAAAPTPTVTFEPELRAIAAPAAPPPNAGAKTPDVPPVQAAPDDQVTQLRGPALKIAENMSASLAIPTATSQRVMPVKVIDEKGHRRESPHHQQLSRPRR
jgi:2-oxoglutarate dehydrogenase E1 component